MKIKDFVAEKLGVYKVIKVPVIKYKTKLVEIVRREVIWISHDGKECSCDITDMGSGDICDLMKSINKSWKPKKKVKKSN